MWRRRRTTSSLPTSTTGPSSTTSSTGRRSRLPRWPDLAPRLADARAPHGCAGAGWRHADTAACGGAKGHADPAGQSAGTAERHDQSCREGWLARRGADRKAERDAAGQCAGRAAFDPAFAEDQRPAGSGCQGRATRASERCGIARRRQSEREACAGRGRRRHGSRCEARDRRDRSRLASRRAGRRASPATRRRRAAKARCCDCPETSIAA